MKILHCWKSKYLQICIWLLLKIKINKRQACGHFNRLGKINEAFYSPKNHKQNIDFTKFMTKFMTKQSITPIDESRKNWLGYKNSYARKLTSFALLIKKTTNCLDSWGMVDRHQWTSKFYAFKKRSDGLELAHFEDSQFFRISTKTRKELGWWGWTEIAYPMPQPGPIRKRHKSALKRKIRCAIQKIARKRYKTCY